MHRGYLEELNEESMKECKARIRKVSRRRAEVTTRNLATVKQA